jgi:Tfp pilus assembly protein FimV
MERNEIRILREKVVRLEARVLRLKNKVSGLRGKLAEKDRQIARRDKQIATKDEQIAALEERLEQLSSQASQPVRVPSFVKANVPSLRPGKRGRPAGHEAALRRVPEIDRHEQVPLPQDRSRRAICPVAAVR